MQPAVGCQHRSRIQANRRARQIREAPACLGRRWRHRRRCRGCSRRFPPRHRSCRPQANGSAGNPRTRARDSLRPRPGRSAAIDHPRPATSNSRTRASPRKARSTSLTRMGSAVQIRAAASLGMGELAVDRGAGYAEHDLAAAHERDLRREERILAHERLGAVDGIDQPYALRRQIARIGLLADKSRTQGKRASRTSRIAISQRTSASVTGVRSALMRTSTLLQVQRARDVRRACGGLECGLELG